MIVPFINWFVVFVAFSLLIKQNLKLQNTKQIVIYKGHILKDKKKNERRVQSRMTTNPSRRSPKCNLDLVSFLAC